MGWCRSRMRGAAPTAAKNITVPGMRNLLARLAYECCELDTVACFIFSWLFCVGAKGPSGVLGCLACCTSRGVIHSRSCSELSAPEQSQAL